MTEVPCKTMDRRVRRTRQLLHDALDRLLETRAFESISVQDITDVATLNRATFYDHYPDKAALLKCLVAIRFQALLDARCVRFDATCGSPLAAIARGVCDYLEEWSRQEDGQRRPLDPHLEGAVINVVRDLMLDGLKRHVLPATPSLEMVAATVSWAIYGGAREWLETPQHPPSEEAAVAIMTLVKPVLSVLKERAPTGAGVEACR